MSEAPERIWGGVYTSEITTYKPFHSAVGYVREDLYEAAKADNARLREAQAWQPIETAPKDGTLFVAVGFVKEHAYATVGGFELWDIEEGIWGFHDHNASEWFEDEKDWPTHWMPLPEPPKETDK